MPKYQIVCEVQQSSDIFIEPDRSGDYVVCDGGIIQLIEYQPTLGDLSLTEVSELISGAILVFAIAFIFREIYQFIKDTQ